MENYKSREDTMTEAEREREETSKCVSKKRSQSQKKEV